MAPKKKGNKASLNRAERNKLLVAGRARDQKLKHVSKEQRVEEERGRSYTSKLLPGESHMEIKAGPIRSSFRIARAVKIFLPR
jgi:hypothetical protein